MSEAGKKREMCNFAVSLPGIVFDLYALFTPFPSRLEYTEHPGRIKNAR